MSKEGQVGTAVTRRKWKKGKGERPYRLGGGVALQIGI